MIKKLATIQPSLRMSFGRILFRTSTALEMKKDSYGMTASF
jgi:hypothetical protein